MVGCIFCDIADGRTHAEKVYESTEFLVIKDINPVSPVHLLVLPKVHVESVVHLDERFPAAKLFQVIREVAKRTGLDERGFRVVINTGEDAVQSIHHLHVHLLGGRKLDWPPG
jgi:histidine triad (HIT) family protein